MQTTSNYFKDLISDSTSKELDKIDQVAQNIFYTLLSVSFILVASLLPLNVVA